MNPVISQSGLVTAYGWGIDALWDGLLTGKTAIKSTDRFFEHGFVSDQAAMIPELKVDNDESRVMAMLRPLLQPLVGKIDANTLVILATTVGEIEYVERSILQEQPGIAEQSRPLVLLDRIKQLLGLRGEGMVLSSACASSASALTRAASLVRHREHRAVLVVSCDSVSEFVYSGFSTLLSLCDTPARPFDAERNGLTLGEAAAWALITADDQPGEVSILGWGSTNDAVHMTAPDRNAGGLFRAINKACAMAKRAVDDIAFIAAHGTATMYSDAMELRAFSATSPNPKPTFSIKGAIGHTLAAAGLAQILVAARAMKLGIVPPTIGFSTPDAAATDWVHSQSIKLDRSAVALSTNSGFGGVNTAILLGRGDQA